MEPRVETPSEHEQDADSRRPRQIVDARGQRVEKRRQGALGAAGVRRRDERAMHKEF